MNQKELNEIRRRFRLDKNNFSRIFGCYVNSNREVISWIDASLGLMRQEEQEMYLGLLKKTLSGTLGRNLIDIEFSTTQVADSDEHRLHGSRTPLRFSQNAPLPCGGSRPVRTASRSDCGWMSTALALACRNETIFRNIP